MASQENPVADDGFSAQEAAINHLYNVFLQLEEDKEWHRLFRNHYNPLLQYPSRSNPVYPVIIANELTKRVHATEPRYPVTKATIAAFADCISGVQGLPPCVWMRFNRSARAWIDPTRVCRKKKERVWMPLPFWKDADVVTKHRHSSRTLGLIKYILKANYICNRCILLRELDFYGVVRFLSTRKVDEASFASPLCLAGYEFLRDCADELCSSVSPNDWDDFAAQLPPPPQVNVMERGVSWQPGRDEKTAELCCTEPVNPALLIVKGIARTCWSANTWRLSIHATKETEVYRVDHRWPTDAAPLSFQDALFQGILDESVDFSG